MNSIAGRPIGVTLGAILVAINGVASLVEAFAVAELTMIGVLEAAVLTLIGLALLHRAYGLWTLQRGALLLTLIILGLRLVLSLFLLFADPSSLIAWARLVLITVTILYLIQPNVRDLFSGGRTGAGIEK